MHRLGVLLGIIGVLLNSPASAKALVRVNQPQIYLNRDGQGYRPVVRDTEAVPGDLVMANDTGHGLIVYPDCEVEVLPGRVYTVYNHPGEVADTKEFRPKCRRPIPYLLIGAAAAGLAVGICAAADCFEEEQHKKHKKKVQAASP
jgi:hypothetical protein